MSNSVSDKDDFSARYKSNCRWLVTKRWLREHDSANEIERNNTWDWTVVYFCSASCDFRDRSTQASNIRLETVGSDSVWTRAALQTVENAAQLRRLPDGIDSAEPGYRFGYALFAR